MKKALECMQKQGLRKTEDTYICIYIITFQTYGLSCIECFMKGNLKSKCTNEKQKISTPAKVFPFTQQIYKGDAV